jgi:hypothetical protein
MSSVSIRPFGVRRRGLNRPSTSLDHRNPSADLINFPVVQQSGMLRFALLTTLAAACLVAQNMPPEAEKQLARDIYKQFVELGRLARVDQ